MIAGAILLLSAAWFIAKCNPNHGLVIALVGIAMMLGKVLP